MLNFGLIRSLSGTGILCLNPEGELIYDYTFDCNGARWVEFNGTAVYDDGKATVTRSGPGGQIYQNIELEAGVEYYLDLSVTATTSSAYVNIVEPDSTSSFPIDYVDVGNHNLVFTPTQDGIHRIGIGCNNPNGSTATFDWLSIHKLAVTETPCMTSSTSPYGIVSSSSYFSSSYPAYKGMNCANSSTNCWISASRNTSDVPDDGVARGDYFDWRLTQDDLDNGMPEMIPTSIIITPRAGMNASWYFDRNPKGLAIFGIKGDNTFEEIFRDDNLPDWNNGNLRQFTFTTQNKFKGFRVYITKVNWEASDGNYNTAWGKLKMYGKYPVLTTDSGETLTTDDGEELWA